MNRFDWWRDATVYQIYPRSFADANGDGMGDLAGITRHLHQLAWLGVDAIWLSPFYRSPQFDAGYDVEDYCDVDPMFGTLADFDALAAQCHRLGMRLIVDIVPNHSSSAHPAFQAALAAAPGSPERELYVFRDGKGPEGDEPPNNWGAPGGRGAWTRTTNADGTKGQWYLHIFGVDQPDWNWDNPRVRDMFDDIVRFWLARGVDGFRVDAACGLVKAPGLPDQMPAQGEGHLIQTVDAATRPPMWDQEGVHDIYRRWNRVLHEFGDDKMMVSEAWLEPERLKRYVRPGEMQESFNGDLLVNDWDARVLAPIIGHTLAEYATVDALPTWVLSNHDYVRHTTRLVSPYWFEAREGIGPRDPQPDQELGQRRGRAATLLMLALPGAAYLFNGEELGLPEVTDIPDELRQDYLFHETHGARVGRDGCRVPMPWRAAAPAFGFNTTGESWLPQPDWFAPYAWDAEEDDPASTLSLYREALRLRRDHGLGGPCEDVRAEGSAIIVSRPSSAVVVTLGPEPATIGVPESLVPQLSSGDTPILTEDGRWTIPGDTGVWFLPPTDVPTTKE